jgi:hypothetical protein
MSAYYLTVYTVAELCELACAYVAGTGVSLSRLSILAARHNRLFERLLKGYDCRADMCERASDWFDHNWPDDVPWPKGVKRRATAA